MVLGVRWHEGVLMSVCCLEMVYTFQITHFVSHLGCILCLGTIEVFVFMFWVVFIAWVWIWLRVSIHVWTKAFAWELHVYTHSQLAPLEHVIEKQKDTIFLFLLRSCFIAFSPFEIFSLYMLHCISALTHSNELAVGGVVHNINTLFFSFLFILFSLSLLTLTYFSSILYTTGVNPTVNNPPGSTTTAKCKACENAKVITPLANTYLCHLLFLLTTLSTSWKWTKEIASKYLQYEGEISLLSSWPTRRLWE